MAQTKSKEIPFFPEYDPIIVDTEEEAKRLNEERSILKKVFFPIDSRVVSQEKINQILDPNYEPESKIGEVNPHLRDILALKDNQAFQDQYRELNNLKAVEHRKTNENSVQNAAYDFFHNKLGLSPSTASNLTSLADFTPIYGELVSVQDAANAFKNGHMGEAAFHSGLVAIGVLPFAGDLLVNALKPMRKSIQGETNKLPLGTKSMFAYDDSSIALQTSGGKVQLNSNLQKSKDDFLNFIKSKDEFKNKIDVDQNGEEVYTGNIILELKTMPQELADEVTNKLDEMWVKNGWTVGLNGRFFTEIDDSLARFDSEKFLNHQRNSIRSNNNFGTLYEEEIVPDAMNLEDVLYHPKLYEAYPELRKLPIQMMKQTVAIKKARTAADYTPSSNAKIRLHPQIFQVEGRVGFNTKGATRPWANWYKSFEKDLYTTTQESALDKPYSLVSILHEVQHAIQHIEGFPVQRDGAVLDFFAKRSQELRNEAVRLQNQAYNLNKTINKINEEVKKGNIVPYAKKLINESQEKINLNYIKQLHLKYDIDELTGRTQINDVYYNSWNEIESRNVENRLWMDMSQRRKISPYHTMSSGKRTNRRQWIKEFSRKENGRIDMEKYHKTMNLFEENIVKQAKQTPDGFPQNPDGTLDLGAAVHEYLFQHVSPLELAGFDKATGIKVDGVFRRMFREHIEKDLKKNLQPFEKVKRKLKGFFINADANKSIEDIEYRKFMVQWQNSLADSKVKVGLKDVHYYDTRKWMQQSTDPSTGKLKDLEEVTPTSEVTQDPFPLPSNITREPFEVGNPNKRFNVLREDADLTLQTDNPQGDFAGEYYRYDYGKFYGDESKKRVQKMYEDGELEDFIDLYRETGGANMSEADIVDEYFDGNDFKITGYIKDNKTVKFNPSELIDFPGAMAEHRTRNLPYGDYVLTGRAKRLRKEAEDFASEVKSFRKKPADFIRKYYDAFENESFGSQEILDLGQKFKRRTLGEDIIKSIELKDEHIEAIVKKVRERAIDKLLKNKVSYRAEIVQSTLADELLEVVFKSEKGITDFKLKNLKERIAKEGYKPDPIHVVVREDGKPFIYEGNHRLQEAFDSGRDFIEAKLTYIRGGEKADGPLHPERIGIKR